MSIDPNNPQIPLLGQPCEVYGGDVTAIFRCKCRPDNKPTMITSVGIAFVCDRCFNVYRIAGVLFDLAAGQTGIQLAVAMVGTARPDPTEEPEGEPEKATTRKLTLM